MLRRRASHLLFSSEDPSIPIAFEDKAGVPNSKRKKLVIEEGEEKKLEEKVFGIQPSCGFHDNKEEAEEEDVDEPQTRRHPVLDPVPVWEDEDDQEVTVDIAGSKGLRKLRKTEEESVITGQEYTDRLRTQFQKLSQQPLWSLPDNDREYSDSESDDNVNNTTETNVDTSFAAKKLPGGLLKIKRMKDANINRKAEAVIQSVEFHPSSNVVLTAGMHKTLSLFQIDGDSNPHLQSVFLKRFPIKTAHFTSNGEEVVMAGDKHWYYVYDIVSGKVTQIHEIKGHGKESFKKFSVSPDNKLLAFLGKDGYMAMVSNKTKQWVGDLKMNGSVTDVAFTPDSSKLLSTGTDGDVYVWDLRSMDCVHRFVDDGCVKGTTVSVSPNGQFIATGSTSGVVNIYDQSCLTLPKPRPLKSVMNLTTSVGHTMFNPSNEILAISSLEKKTAIKLVHLSSMSVYSNWPASHISVDYVYSTDFSSDSRYMVLGNARGKAPLFRLNHFHSNKQD